MRPRLPCYALCLALACSCGSAPPVRPEYRPRVPDWAWDLRADMSTPHAVQAQLWGVRVGEIFALGDAASGMDPNEARRRIQELQDGPPGPDLAAALMALGDAEKDRELARARLNEAASVLASLPADGENLYRLGKVYQRLERDRDALEAYGHSLDLAPEQGRTYTAVLDLFPGDYEHWNAWRRKGTEFFELRMQDLAAGSAGADLIKEYVRFRIVRDLQKTMYDMGDPEYVRRLRQLSSEPVAYFQERFRPFFGDRNVELLRLAIAASPDDGQALAILGTMLVGRAFVHFTPVFSYLEDSAGSAEQLNGLLDAFRRGQGPLLQEASGYLSRAERALGRELPFVASDLGFVNLSLGRWDQAVEQYLREQRLTDTLDPFVKGFMVRYFQYYGTDMSAAEQDLRGVMDALQAWTEVRSDPVGWYTLGAMAARVGRRDEAETAFRRALAARADWWKARFSLALTLMRGVSKDGLFPEEALSHLREARRALGTDPDAEPGAAATVQEAMALAYLLSGRIEDARMEAEDCLAASGPGRHSVAREILERLRGEHAP